MMRKKRKRRRKRVIGDSHCIEPQIFLLGMMLGFAATKHIQSIGKKNEDEKLSTEEEGL